MALSLTTPAKIKSLITICILSFLGGYIYQGTKGNTAENKASAKSSTQLNQGVANSIAKTTAIAAAPSSKSKTVSVPKDTSVPASSSSSSSSSHEKLVQRSSTPNPSFKNDVLPVFSRHGCNAGNCHGAASGKDGFMLSLFGYDVPGDFYRITEQIPGRRINLAAPEESLLLSKATGEVSHSGGELFTKDHPDYQVLLNWVSNGAKRDLENAPNAESIRVEPSLLEFSSPEEAMKNTKVIATFSDGTEKDVTHWSLFLSSNEGVVSIDEYGKVKANRPGGAHVFARFNRFTEGAEVFVLPKDDNLEWSPPPVSNYIDEYVFNKLEKLRIQPSPISTDEHFLRRVTIDIAGTVPSPEEYHSFLADNSPDRRAKKIEELLSRDSFADIWTTKWGEWLRLRTDTNVQFGTSPKAGEEYYKWLREQFHNDLPLNKLFEKLITGTGSTYNNPESNFYTMLPQSTTINPSILGQNVAQVALGIRTNCAECHNHPFDRWTMDDYYQWTSFFTGIKRKVGRSAEEMLISADINAEPAPHLLHGEPAPHRFLGGDAPDVKGKDARKILATWLTKSDNTLFRENLANRAWEHFFGRGIVEPIDDIRVSNPPSNGPLLKELGRRLAEDHEYSLRDLVRDICNSSTYQLSASTLPSNADDNEFFSHAALRRPRADILFDSLNAAMGNIPKIRKTNETRAIALREGNSSDTYNKYFFTTFGQAKRLSVCGCETIKDSSLSQSLHLINGNTIMTALERDTNLIKNLLKEHPEGSEADAKQIIENLYIRALTRKPTPEEFEIILSVRPDPKDKKARRTYYDGILWSLLNSSEFLLNH